MTDKLPDDYRIITYAHDGSGRGDEIFGYALQHWRSFSIKRFLRKPSYHRGWVTIATTFRSHKEDLADLHQTARLLIKDQT